MGFAPAAIGSLEVCDAAVLAEGFDCWPGWTDSQRLFNKSLEMPCQSDLENKGAFRSGVYHRSRHIAEVDKASPMLPDWAERGSPG